MPIQLSDHFSYRRLIKFTWPSMMMMLITSVYGVVDGVMVSNFAGTTPFAALNLIWPFVAILGSVGFMIGTGGSALVAKTLGMGEPERARSIFSMLTYSTLGISGFLGIIGLLLVEKVARLLGAEGEMVAYCVEYGSILLYALPCFMMQIYFQSLLVTAERPKMGMWVTVGAGLMNVLLDILFIGLWHWGLPGAAWATVISQAVGGGVPLLALTPALSLKGEGALWLLPPSRISLSEKANKNSPSPFRERAGVRVFLRACFNGLSEFVMQISLSIVAMLYMFQLLRQAGENGVAAYGIMMYFAFVFSAVFLGLRPRRQLPLRRGQPGGAKKPPPQKPPHHRPHRPRHRHPRPAPLPSPLRLLRRLRPRAPRPHHPRLPHLLPHVPRHRLQRLRLRLLHRPQQRPRLRLHLPPPHPRPRNLQRPPSPPPLRHRRHLVVRHPRRRPHNARLLLADKKIPDKVWILMGMWEVHRGGVREASPVAEGGIINNVEGIRTIGAIKWRFRRF